MVQYIHQLKHWIEWYANTYALKGMEIHGDIMHTVGDVTHRVTGYKRLSKIPSNISQYYLW